MDGIVGITYRCNAKCHMCNTWQYPTDPTEEIKPETLEKLPDLNFVNVTGGEPFLRQNIGEIVEVLLKKAKRVVISTNGFFTKRIIQFAKENPNIGIRISIEGLPRTNDKLRGIKDGFDKGLRTLLELKNLGLKDIGFGITLSDANAIDLLEVYRLANALGMEFATAVTHNSYYFHKHDNHIENKDLVAAELTKLISEFLKSRRIKDWYRAYFNYGLINYLYGGQRLLPCEVGTDIFYLDPHSRILPCNGMDEELGNLNKQSFSEIWHGQKAQAVREKVAVCEKNCWMIGSASPAMKKNILVPTSWVLKNKFLSKRPEWPEFLRQTILDGLSPDKPRESQ